jgi:hypothetical protein
MRRAAANRTDSRKRILLVDLDDIRRKTRVQMLAAKGYDVEVRANHLVSESFDREPGFDLVILALHRKSLEDAAAYCDRLRKKHPTLPILLLTDTGVFVPHGTLCPSMETGFPVEMMREIAEMLEGSAHIREIKQDWKAS